MSKFNPLIFLFTLTYSFSIAQSPQQFAYHAVVRDNNNQLVSNRTIGMRVSILKDSTNGQSAYTETHSPKTNQQGIVPLNIGGGTVVSGSFASVPWSSGKLFIKTELAILGGSNYSISGTTQLLSIPYALYSSDVPVRKSGDTVTIGTSKLIIPGSQLLPAAAPASLSIGLVAFYPFNGNANDESGNGNNGTVNGAQLTTDRFGNFNKAYSFNGSNNYIEVLDNMTLRPDYITLSGWAKTSSSVGAIIGKTNFSSAQNEQYLLNIFNSNSLLSIKQNSNCAPGNGWLKIDAPKNISDDQWHFLVGSFDGSFLKIYIDGVLVQTSNDLQLNRMDNCVGGNLHIGRWWAADTQYFNGIIDDVRIYNRALTQEEITYLANN